MRAGMLSVGSRPMRARTWVLVVVVGLAAVAGAGVLSMYPSLSDARDQVEEQWVAVTPQIEPRYQALATLSRAVRAAQGDLDLLDEVDDAVGDWQALATGRTTPDPDLGTAAANRLEGLGARLARTAAARPGLRANGDVALALRDYAATDPRAVLTTYNESVEKYDRARSRFPGPFFASILGFDAMDTLEVPGVFDDLDLPEPPATTATTAAAPVTPGE